MNKMMLRTTVATIATCLLGCQFALAQIELTYKKQLTIVGATSPEILQGGRILAEDDSKISISSVAVLRVSSTDGVRLIAQRAFREFAELIPLGSTTDGESKIVTSRYLLVGEGRYTIDAISRTNDAWDRSVTIDIGTITPPPLPPPPLPPPPIDIPNEYNVGTIAYTTAPSNDAVMAKQIAGWYRIGASKLFGGGGLADIQTIRDQIHAQFTGKQCKDKATCEQWERWRVAVSAAIVAEQVQRKTFTRQDWYTALIEVATALESRK